MLGFTFCSGRKLLNHRGTERIEKKPQDSCFSSVFCVSLWFNIFCNQHGTE